jgi:hypothetical protein
MSLSKLSDGVFIVVDREGYVSGGANSSGAKVYVYLGTAKKRAGKSGKVYRVDDKGVTLVWPEAKTFFLNERHEIPPDPSPKLPPMNVMHTDLEKVCSACGEERCYGFLCYGID